MLLLDWWFLGLVDFVSTFWYNFGSLVESVNRISLKYRNFFFQTKVTLLETFRYGRAIPVMYNIVYTVAYQ